MTAINTIVPALIAGNSGGAETRDPDACWWANGWPSASTRRACRRTCSRMSSSTTTRPRTLISDRPLRLHQLHRLGRRRRRGSNRPRRAPSPGSGSSSAARIRATWREDADLEAAVATLMDAAMYNAGQCCCGIERIYVHESLYDAFVEKAVAFARGLHARQPARRGHDARADGGEALRRRGARPDRRRGRGGGHGACRDLRRRTTAAPTSRRRC